MHAVWGLSSANPRIRRPCDRNPYRWPGRRAREVYLERTLARVVWAGSPGGLEKRDEVTAAPIEPGLSPPFASHRVLGLSDMKANKIAVIGLGAIGYGVAANLARKGFSVAGADANPAAAERFANEFGGAVTSSCDAASGADVVILVVVSAAQCEAILFGDSGVL